MKAMKPEDCDRLMAEAVNNKDIDSAMTLYEPNASFVVGDGQVAKGHAEIRNFLTGMMGGVGDMKLVKDIQVVLSGDGETALLFGEWKANAKNADGSHSDVGGRNVEVVRRQADGSWLFLIDHPNGADSAT